MAVAHRIVAAVVVGAGVVLTYGLLQTPDRQAAPESAAGRAEIDPVPATTVSMPEAAPHERSLVQPASASASSVDNAAPATAVRPTIPSARSVRFQLAGTSLSNDESIGFLTEVEGSRRWSVRKGDHVDDALVVDVAADHVTLAWGEERRVVAIGDPSPLQRPLEVEREIAQSEPALVGGEPADADSGTAMPASSPPRPPAPALPPRSGGPVPTLNSIDPPFDPAHQKGEAADADDGSD